MQRFFSGYNHGYQEMRGYHNAHARRLFLLYSLFAVRHDLGPNIFPSGSSTSTISIITHRNSPKRTKTTLSKEKYNLLCYDKVTSDLDRDDLSARCQSSSGYRVDWICSKSSPNNFTADYNNKTYALSSSQRLRHDHTQQDPTKQDGVIYRIPCKSGKVHIGETGRLMQERSKEHDIWAASNPAHALRSA